MIRWSMVRVIGAPVADRPLPFDVFSDPAPVAWPGRHLLCRPAHSSEGSSMSNGSCSRVVGNKCTGLRRATSILRRCVGRSDRSAQQPHNQLLIGSLRSGLLVFAPKHQYRGRATFDGASNHDYTYWGWYNLRIR
jgi:hypothetical protein